MGKEIDRADFGRQDYRRFCARLHDNLLALEQILQRPAFGRCPDTLGAELELYLIDGQGRPLPGNRQVLQAFNNSRLTLELNRYNLEYNFDPLPLAGACFSRFQATMSSVLDDLDRTAAGCGGQILPVGILPTLKETDLGTAMMSDEVRYQVLSDRLHQMRKGAFEINIDGDDPFFMQRDDLTAEGVCTSFQIHYCCDISRFVDSWNAMSLVTPVVLGLAANSPLLFGHRLWHETRVPLFKQSIDGRRQKASGLREPARVEFGLEWLRHSPRELFAQMVHLYPPLIPLCSSEDPLEVLARGQLPALDELSLHNGTVWHWNRPIYHNGGEGHIRMEMRALPAGPTSVDMTANAAFYIGLIVGLRDEVEPLLAALPYRYSAVNFYRAARQGMNVELVWPSIRQNRMHQQALRDIALSLLEKSAHGLSQLGIDSADSERLLGVIAARLENGQNGARWQLDSLAALEQRLPRDEALALMLDAYHQNAMANKPVALWEVVR